MRNRENNHVEVGEDKLYPGDWRVEEVLVLWKGVSPHEAFLDRAVPGALEWMGADVST